MRAFNALTPAVAATAATAATAAANNETRRRSRRRRAKNGWLQHVEVTTYCGPHRRLWMGPQFCFGVFTYGGHASAELVSFLCARLALCHYFVFSDESERRRTVVADFYDRAKMLSGSNREKLKRRHFAMRLNGNQRKFKACRRLLDVRFDSL